MSVNSTSFLVEALRQGRLLAPNQLDELTKVLVPRFRDPRALARELLARNWLTPYQVNQLLQGGAKDLVLGQYNLLQRLNDTYVGQVFKARHQHMMRLAALTIVRESLLAQPGAVERFYQEIQQASQLNHPHVLCALDAGPIGRTHFFAMEYVEGTDLDRLVRESGPLPPAAAAALIRQAALGLQHAYERRLLHHDLKPANLLVTKVPSAESQVSSAGSDAGTIKIYNLGLTLLQPRRGGGGNAPPDQAAADTADYLAPEQAAGAPLADVRSNLYSLGCIFYYLLVGRPPFADGDSAVKLQRHQTAEPEPIESFRNDVPGIALDVLGRLLAKRPQDRYATPAEAAQALAGLGGKAPAGAARTRRDGARPAWRKWLPWAGAALALLAASVGAATLLNRPAARIDPSPATEAPPPLALNYRKGPTRQATILTTLRASGYPNLEGKWYYIGPFDNSDKKGFDAVYPPEKGIDLAKTYPGKDGAMVGWQEFKDFALGKNNNLRRFKDNDNTIVYLYHEMESGRAEPLPISFGSDDTLTVWGNGKKLAAVNEYRGCCPDQPIADFPLHRGKNELLIKVGNGNGAWEVYVDPRWPVSLEAAFGKSLNRDFPPKK